MSRSRRAASATSGLLSFACGFVGLMFLLAWIGVWKWQFLAAGVMLGLACYLFGVLWYFASSVEAEWKGPGGPSAA